MEDNIQKYSNYKEQMIRLKKAINNNFYLEAMFIEYAIMEDRCESILRYENNEVNSNKFVSIDQKLKKILKLAGEKKSLPNKYFSDGIIEKILTWKAERNRMIHALMKQSLTTVELQTLALEGQELAKKLCARSTNYKRALEKKQIV